MKRLVTKAPLVAAALFAVVYLGPHALGLRINTSTSMPRGLYRAVSEGLHRGALVAACLPEEVARLGLERHYLGPGECPGGTEPVVKTVPALAGDLVEVTGQGVRINGEVLPQSAPLTTDRGGRPLTRFEGSHRLRPGEVWLHSSYEVRSWDSRYYGPVTESDILFVVTPVLTF